MGTQACCPSVAQVSPGAFAEVVRNSSTHPTHPIPLVLPLCPCLDTAARVNPQPRQRFGGFKVWPTMRAATVFTVAAVVALLPTVYVSGMIKASQTLFVCPRACPLPNAHNCDPMRLLKCKRSRPSGVLIANVALALTTSGTPHALVISAPPRPYQRAHHAPLTLVLCLGRSPLPLPSLRPITQDK